MTCTRGCVAGSISLEMNSIPLSHLSRSERVQVWIYEHPTIVKIVKIVGLLIGVGVLSSLPFTMSILGVGVTVSLALTGGALLVSSFVAFLGLDILIPPHHDMKNHMYKSGQCDGGRLYYEGDVPILALNSDDPSKAGYAHGYLCGEALNQLFKRMDLVMHTIMRQPRAKKLPHTLQTIRQHIPLAYIQEMEGIVVGYTKWAKEHWYKMPKAVTSDDILLFHLLPDSEHFDPEKFEHTKIPTQESNPCKKSIFACAAIVDQDPHRGVVFARNMDWPSMGIAGTYSLVINRVHANGLNDTVEVAVPGLVGTLTGMNDKGLSIAMNVCSGLSQTVRGMPASLYNRVCLERCANRAEVGHFVEGLSPLGPYHLTVADRDGAQTFHFYQSPEGTHVIRLWEKNTPLVTLNFRYDPHTSDDVSGCHSAERERVLSVFFQDRDNRPLEETLCLPYVNNWWTVHSAVMEPKTGLFQVAFDNAFAGRKSWQQVSTQGLFGPLKGSLLN